MNNDNRLTPRQFLIMTLIFSTGSAILFIPSILAATAKRDAWISAIVGTIMGIFLVLFYLKLASTFEGNNLPQMYDAAFGRWMGKVINVQFVIFVWFLSSLLLRGIGDFLATHILDETPMEVILIILLFVTIYGYRQGVTVIARTLEVFLPTILFLYFLGVFLVTKEASITKLFPIMENGIKPVLNGAFSIFNFPFTELVLLLMFLPYVSSVKEAKKPFLLGALFGGISLFFPVFFGVVVFGAEMLSNQVYSTYTLAKKLGIPKVLERIEVILAIIWLLTIYFKVLICYSALVDSIKHLFSLKNSKALHMPIAWGLLCTTILLADTNVYFFSFNAKIWPLYAFTVGLLIPVLTYFAGKFRNR